MFVSFILSPPLDMTIALQFPATSSFPLNQSEQSLSSQAVTHVQSGVHSGENVSLQSCNHHFSFTVLQSRPAAITQPYATTIKAPLSGWWPINMGRELPPIVDVPLAQGKKVSLTNRHHCL
jgi:hypothetical protein